jgi:hypothetical protein
LEGLEVNHDGVVLACCGAGRRQRAYEQDKDGLGDSDGKSQLDW